jgi:hypothetical protein
MTISFNAFRFIVMLLAAFAAMTAALDYTDDGNGEAIVNLGTAANYVILTKAGIFTLATSPSITGNIAVSPAAATYMTGFGLALDSSGVFSKSDKVLSAASKAFAADYNTQGSTTPAVLSTAIGDMMIAYADAAGRDSDASTTNLNDGTLGGSLSGDFGGAQAPLTPGVYTYVGIDVTIANDIYFDGQVTVGDSNAVFIIQISGNLIQNAGTKVHLQNGAQAKNIFWQVTETVTVNADATATGTTEMRGNLLVETKVDFKTYSSLEGRILSKTECELKKATVTCPVGDSCTAEP